MFSFFLHFVILMTVQAIRFPRHNEEPPSSEQEQTRDVNVVNIFIGTPNGSHVQNFGESGALGDSIYNSDISNYHLDAYTDPPEASDLCFAIEKRDLKSKPCVFPFKYKGRVYNGCINRNDPDGRDWCSTAVDEEGFHILGREFWGHCTNNCPADKFGVDIQQIKALPPRGPTLKPFGVTALTDAALDVAGGSFAPVSAPVVVSRLSPTRDLEIPDGIEWFNSAKTHGTWSFDCTFNGNDLQRLRLKAGPCMQKCRQTQGCTHFSWTPLSGGSCFLKKKPVDPDSVIYTENAICGFFVQTEEKVSNIEWLPDDSALGCDFSTPTFHSQPTVRDDCRLMCNKFEECSHFTWKSKPGLRLGDCSLKQGSVDKSSAFKIGSSNWVCGFRIERKTLDSIFPRGITV